MFSSILSRIVAPSAAEDTAQDASPPENVTSSVDEHTSDTYGMTKEEVIQAFTEYAKSKYGGDWDAMFDAFAQENLLSFEQLCFMLRDAQGGSTFTRPIVCRALVHQLDADQDGKISRSEFMKIKEGDFVG